MTKDVSSLRIDPSRKRTSGGGKGWWLLTACLLLAAAATGAYYHLYWGADAAPEAVAARAADEAAERAVASVVAGPREVLIASGYIVSHHRIHLGSKVMGKVVWVGVDKGDRVEKDQLLVRLDDREYRAQVEQAEAAVRAAEARLAELEAGSRTQEIERAGADLERARSERDNAELELERLQKLLEDGVVPLQQVDAAETRYRMAEASVAAAEKNLELLKIGPRPEQIAHARAERDRARATLSYHQTLLEATEIRAPIRGTVLERIAEVGEMVTTSFAGEMGARSAVVALADLDDLRVELDISQSDFKVISREHGCTMTPEAYPDRVYPCEIAEIAPEANRQRATIQVKVRILNPDEYLRPEMSARVRFFEKTSDPAGGGTP